MILTEIINRMVGEQIRLLREQKGMSQEELGFRANLHRSYIGQIERAENNISIKNLAKIAAGLDVNIRELFPD
jgi:XRE family transcriptional regulator, regulator of sulfur utilization